MASIREANVIFGAVREKSRQYNAKMKIDTHERAFQRDTYLPPLLKTHPHLTSPLSVSTSTSVWLFSAGLRRLSAFALPRNQEAYWWPLSCVMLNVILWRHTPKFRALIGHSNHIANIHRRRKPLLNRADACVAIFSHGALPSVSRLLLG